MIGKSNLKGKKVEYLDDDGKCRCKTVLQIAGNTLTVANKAKIGTKRCQWSKERIHPDKNKIFGVYYRNKMVEIDWSRGA
ncbi:MAG: hypothetical protein IMZ53_03425 [Thermoplasmata archaeon]|nr:hypothetical protein [Thermoplasmata archaeon]MBE3139615.1 hypothetical protein [Thermoplasmata archaeon]